MKKSKKLIPAIAMLMVSAILLTSASYAWFTMSREVTATGMNVKITAPTNLLISNATDGTYAATASRTDAATTIMPSSSISGKTGTFYALEDGSSVTASTGVLTDNSQFKLVDDTTEAGTYYQDFKYYVKTEGNTDVSVYIKDFTVTRNGSTASDDGLKAVRAAVIATDAAGTGDSNATTKRVCFPTGYSYRVTGKAGSGLETNATVTSNTKSLATDTALLDDDTSIFTATKNGAVQPIIVRVWFEGEDATCNVTQAANLDFNVEIVLADISTKA